MVEVIELTGRKASNLIGAMGEVIAWDTLRKKGIWAYKIGQWSFFPSGYPYWKGELNEEHRFLTREQAEYVENKGHVRRHRIRPGRRQVGKRDP